MSSRPRNPRYFPRMKVRGARRKRLRAMYAFQRLGDVGAVSARQLNMLGVGFVDVHAVISREYHGPKLGGAIPQHIVDETAHATGGQITGADLDRLAHSIRRTDGSHR